MHIPPPLWMLLTSLAMATAHVTLPIATLIPNPYRFAGSAFILLGLLLGAWSSLGFFKAKTPILPFKNATTLLTTGPYRITRNPIYLAMALMLLGLATLLATATPFLFPPLFTLIITYRFIHPEENSLQKTFGQAYKTYRNKVRRWI